MTALQRTLSINTGPAAVPVPIDINLPFQDGGSWRCTYSIGWPGGIRNGHAMGFDAVQALGIALNFIAIDLYASPYHKAGALVWDEPGAGYGFPLPHGGRHLAIGADKTL
jgi:hypothetical protein